jgi:hypothetical protein
MNDNSRASDFMSIKTGKGFDEGLYFDVNMHIELFDEKGNLKQEEFVHNTVTTAGKTGMINQLLASPTLPTLGWLAVGTGTPGGTLLGAEIARVAFTSKTASTNVLTVAATFNAGTGTGAITEAGTFDVVTANTVNMWMSASFGVVNKGASDSLTITWTLTVN